MVFRTASAIVTLLIGLGGAGGQGLAQDYPPAHAIRRARDPTDLYQNSQTLTHAAGVLPGLPFPKRAEVQLDMGAALGVDAGANESTSPQVGIKLDDCFGSQGSLPIRFPKMIAPSRSGCPRLLDRGGQSRSRFP